MIFKEIKWIGIVVGLKMWAGRKVGKPPPPLLFFVCLFFDFKTEFLGVTALTVLEFDL